MQSDDPDGSSHHPDAPPPDPRPQWPLEGGHDVRDELLAAYGDATRGYHDTRHLAEVLTRLDELRTAGTSYDVVPVVLAAWFHDAVYDGERDAEERSAAWAEEALPGLVDAATVAEVARLVRLTESHQPKADDAGGRALSDADLGILAAPADRYDAYAAAVRKEYGHLSDEVFTAGRRSVLADLAARERLFHTAHGRECWEDAARANIARELADLGA